MEEIIDMREVEGWCHVPFQGALYNVPSNGKWKRFQSTDMECDVFSSQNTHGRKDFLGKGFDVELFRREKFRKLQERSIQLSIEMGTEYWEDLFSKSVAGVLKALIACVGMDGQLPKMAHPFDITATHRQERSKEEKGGVFSLKEG